MLHLKRGLPSSFSKASSSRASLAVAHVPRRLYADKGSNNNSRKNVFESLLGSVGSSSPAPSPAPPRKTPNPQSNPQASRMSDSADKDALFDILSPKSRSPPDSRPPMRPGMKGRARGFAPTPAPVAPVSGSQSSTYDGRQGLNVPHNYVAPEGEQSVPEDLENPENLGNPEASERSMAHPKDKAAAKRLFNVSSVTGFAQYRLYVNAAKKNCIMTLIDESSHLRAQVSSGSCGFRNAAEGSYEAGYQCCVRMFDKIRREVINRRDEIQLEVLMKGFGSGRSAVLKALTMSEGDGIREIVNRLTDRTPVKIGGVRLKKARRL